MTNNSVYDASNPLHIYAGKVVERIKNDNSEAAADPEFGSIIIILSIISITIAVIRFIYDCRHSKDVPGICRAPSLLDRITVRREIRKVLKRDMFKKYEESIMDAMFKVGANTEPAQVECMFQLSKNN